MLLLLPMPEPSPQSVQAFFAAIASALAATKTWLELRDRSAAKRAGEEAQSRVLADPETLEAATRLLAIVPPDTLERMMERYKKCYDKFNKLMDDEDDNFGVDVDRAARKALPNCVCRALNTIKAVAGALPDPALEEAWTTYDCELRLNDEDE